MEQALIIHFKRGSCPVLICQWAQTQHFGTTIVVESDRNNPVDDHPLSALLHRYFDLSQAGREHDSTSCPAFELAHLWFPMLYTPCWTPLQGLTWFRHTADWLSHFPEMPHTTFVTDQAFAMIRVLGHQPPIAWAWALDTESIPHQRWHAVPIHESTHEQLQVIKQILGHFTQILAQNDLHQLAHPPDDGSATDRRRSILPGLAECMPRRLQAATTRDIVHRPSEEWPRATEKELDIIHEYIRQQGWGPDPDAEPTGPSAGGHPEPAWTRSEPDDLSSMWQGLIDAIPARTGQAVEHSAPSRGNDNFTPTDNVPSSVHRTDHSGQQVEPDGKRRRTGSWPQGQRNPDRGSEMAVPVMEPGSQGSTAEPEDSTDVRRCLSDSPTDPSAGREPQFGVEICGPATADVGQFATRCRHRNSMEAGREPSRSRSSGTTYAPAQVGRQRHYTTHPYEDAANHVAEIATGGCNLPQIAQVLRGIMTTSLMNPHFAGSGMDHPFDDTARA